MMRTGYLRACGVIVSGLMLLASLLVMNAEAAQHARPHSVLAAAAGGPALPAALLPRVNASVAADDPAYAVAALPEDAATLCAANPAHHLTTTFAPDGVAFAGEGDARWSLRLSGVGAGAPRVVAPVVVGQRVEYRRGDMTEWYLNGPLGVEQGFTLASPPASGDALTLILAVGGGATPRLDADAVTLAVPGGATLTYGHLLVTDAAGTRLPAHLSVADGEIAIRADLAGATYPVTVDPLVQQKILAASDGVPSDDFGLSVGMSADGTKVVVGAYGRAIGAAYIYSGANYATQTKLLAGDGTTSFGYAVAMSSDGTRVVVGADVKTVGANTSQGGAYVYSGLSYATETRLLASDGAAFDLFGSAVAISADGARVVVGAPQRNGAQGGAYVYGGANYASETKLLASDGAANDLFGESVAISGDGAKVVVGARFNKVGANAYQGAAYVYSGANYATEKKLTASDGAAGDQFGDAVGMSADGTKVVVAAIPAAYVYGGTNDTSETKLVASDGAGALDAVAMSSDGAKVVVGAPSTQIGANAQQGGAYVYSGANYATETRLLASDGAAYDDFGESVAISADGAKVIAGAWKRGNRPGAAYVFANVTPPNPLPPPQPTVPPAQGGPPNAMPGSRPSGPTGGPAPNPLPAHRP